MKIVITIGVCIILHGCAFSAVKRPDITTTNNPVVGSYNLSNKQATENASKALTIMGYTPVTDSDGGIVTNMVAIPVPANCDCGTWNGKDVTGTANSQFKVKFVGDGNVKMDLLFSCGVTFTATNLYGVPTRSEQYQCASKGIIERKFLDKFNEYL
jgi:hypothetical protein